MDTIRSQLKKAQVDIIQAELNSWKTKFNGNFSTDRKMFALLYILSYVAETPPNVNMHQTYFMSICIYGDVVSAQTETVSDLITSVVLAVVDKLYQKAEKLYNDAPFIAVVEGLIKI